MICGQCEACNSRRICAAGVEPYRLKKSHEIGCCYNAAQVRYHIREEDKKRLEHVSKKNK